MQHVKPIARQQHGSLGLLRYVVADIESSRPGETIIWVDRFGTLLISRTLDDRGRGYSLRLADQVRVYVIDGKPALIESAPGVTQATIDHFLDDQVLPRVISGSGTFVLHAAAIVIGGAAILLQGDSGRGKSTLSASFHQQGFRLLGDDAVILEPVAGILSVAAVYPSLRLLPDALRSLFPGDQPAHRVSQNSDKHSVEFAPEGGDEGRPVPIAAAFILSGEDAPDPVLRRLGQADACMELVKNSFSIDPGNADMAQRKLDFAATISEQVPMYDIAYPRDFARLRDVTSALIDVL